jgi:hypothetical protein
LTGMNDSSWQSAVRAAAEAISTRLGVGTSIRHTLAFDSSAARAHDVGSVDQHDGRQVTAHPDQNRIRNGQGVQAQPHQQCAASANGQPSSRSNSTRMPGPRSATVIPIGLVVEATGVLRYCRMAAFSALLPRGEVALGDLALGDLAHRDRGGPGVVGA